MGWLLYRDDGHVSLHCTFLNLHYQINTSHNEPDTTDYTTVWMAVLKESSMCADQAIRCSSSVPKSASTSGQICLIVTWFGVTSRFTSSEGQTHSRVLKKSVTVPRFIAAVVNYLRTFAAWVLCSQVNIVGSVQKGERINLTSKRSANITNPNLHSHMFTCTMHGWDNIDLMHVRDLRSVFWPINLTN